MFLTYKPYFTLIFKHYNPQKPLIHHSQSVKLFSIPIKLLQKQQIQNLTQENTPKSYHNYPFRNIFHSYDRNIQQNMFLPSIVFCICREVDVLYYHLNQQKMCFIKKSLNACTPLINSKIFPIESSHQLTPIKHSYSGTHQEYDFPSSSSLSYSYPNNYNLLTSVLALASFNSNLLMKLHHAIDQSSLRIIQAQTSIPEDNKSEEMQGAMISEDGWRSKDPKIQKLFGAKNYKYKLKLRHKLPNTIYKERNFGLSFELLDGQDKPVLNSNLINICMAACEGSGQWISENEEGKYFIQGKTEVELYHGEALFEKIYPRDVSRMFDGGKISIVVYPKPSLIQFSNSSSSLEERVKAEDIEPIIIKDITIRAKKKTN